MGEISLARIDILVDNELNCEDEPRRKARKNSIVVTIEHFTSSVLDDVGLQLWNGAFLLTDYLISIRNQLSNKVIVELGGGCGLCGIVLSLIPTHGCIVTDYAANILSLCRSNLNRNSHLILSSPFGCSSLSNVFVRKLDWFDLSCDVPMVNDKGDHTEYLWTTQDENLLRTSNRLFVAADVIYDDVLTEALFIKLSQLMTTNDKLIMTLEKRYNCALANQAVTANGYDLFLRMVNAAVISESSPPVGKYIKNFKGTRLDVDEVKQSLLCYERSEDLELWEIVMI